MCLLMRAMEPWTAGLHLQVQRRLGSTASAPVSQAKSFQPKVSEPSILCPFSEHTSKDERLDDGYLVICLSEQEVMKRKVTLDGRLLSSGLSCYRSHGPDLFELRFELRKT